MPARSSGAKRVAIGPDANDFAAVLIEAWEGAVMRGKVEQSAGPCRHLKTPCYRA